MFIQLIKVMIMSLAIVSVGQAHDEGACKDDIEKFCKGIEPGRGRLMKCLKGHDSQLSPACKESGHKMKEKMQAFMEACKADQEKFCKDVKPGRGRFIRCLKNHKDELSTECKTAMENKKAHHGSED